MKRVGKNVAVVAAVMMFLGASMLDSGALRAGIAFDLSIDPAELSLEEAPGTTSYNLDLILTPSGDLGGNGAQGWSLSVAADGCAAITGITDEGTAAADVSDGGLRNTGFAVNQVTVLAGAGSDCDGLNGGVQAIVLSFVMPITLPAEGPSHVGVLTVEATIPAPGEELAGSVAYTNGCQGDGQPVDNNVTHQGNTVTPSLGSHSLTCIGSTTCTTAAELNLILQTENTFQVPDLAAAMVPDGSDDDVIEEGSLTVPVATGATGAVTLFGAIVSNLGGGGVQGCSAAVGVSGDVNLAGVSIDGTVSATVNDGGLQNTGFNVVETVDPDREPSSGALAGQGPQGQGAVFALVLSFVMPITLDPIGTATFIALDIEAGGTQGTDAYAGQVNWQDGLQGSGQPVQNVATVEGNTVQFCTKQSAAITFVEQPDVRASFVRGDANDDSRLDIADPIYTINQLFRDGPDFVCADAADFDNDGMVDVSDATAGIAYQFQGGSAPATSGCAIDDEDSEDGSSSDEAGVCESATAACS